MSVTERERKKVKNRTSWRVLNFLAATNSCVELLMIAVFQTGACYFSAAQSRWVSKVPKLCVDSCQVWRWKWKGGNTGRFTALKRTVKCGVVFVTGKMSMFFQGLKKWPPSSIVLNKWCTKSVVLCSSHCSLLSGEVFGDCELQILAHWHFHGFLHWRGASLDDDVTL